MKQTNLDGATGWKKLKYITNSDVKTNDILCCNYVDNSVLQGI